MSYTCPRRDCDGFGTDDPAVMAAHRAAHGAGSTPVDPRLARRVARIVTWLSVGAVVLVPVALVVLVVLLSVTGAELD